MIDGMALVNTIQKTDSMKTCKDFAEVFVQTLVHLTRSYDEIRLIFDRYVQGSLKQKMRAKRTGGNEVHYHVDDTTNLASIPLKQFLSHIQTKSELTDYLAQKTLKYFSQHQVSFTVVSGTEAKSNNASLSENLKEHSLSLIHI